MGTKISILLFIVIIEVLASVTKKENADQNEHEKHDAKEKGKNEYQGNGGKGKNQYKSPEELEKLTETLIGADGKPLDMHISSGFDFKI